MTNKTEIRKYIKEMKKNLTGEEIRLRSNRIAKKLFESPFYKQSECIYLYVSYNQEVDTVGIIKYILEDKKRVAVPKVVDKNMEFHEITSLDQLSEGAFGIQEPTVNKLVSEDPEWASSNLMIIPGLAFDKNGSRIGHGGGYYDRYLHKYPDKIGSKIALAYDFQVLEHIDIESYDEKIDGIITDED